MIQGKYNTELDEQLQLLACADWSRFVQLVGETHITAAKICMLRLGGKSYNQIANRFNITRGAVRWKSENCDCIKPSEISHQMNAEFRKINN